MSTSPQSPMAAPMTSFGDFDLAREFEASLQTFPHNDYSCNSSELVDGSLIPFSTVNFSDVNIMNDIHANDFDMRRATPTYMPTTHTQWDTQTNFSQYGGTLNDLHANDFGMRRAAPTYLPTMSTQWDTLTNSSQYGSTP
jgi:hypothetical protein